MFIRYLEMRIPVGMFTCGFHPHFRNLVGTSLACDSGKIDFMLHTFLIDHDHMDKVFIDGGIQVLKAKRTEKVNALAFLELEIGVLHAGIVTHFGMQKQQSLFSPGITNFEYYMIPHPQVPPAMRTQIMIFHLRFGLPIMFTSY
jgi:hypothetical protein